jgi:hypothetical protein
MRGLPVERSKVDYEAEWERYYDNVTGVDAKLSLFKMLKERRDRQDDKTAGKALELLVAKWLTEKGK